MPSFLPVRLIFEVSPRLSASLEKLRPIIESGKRKSEKKTEIIRLKKWGVDVMEQTDTMLRYAQQTEKTNPSIESAIPTIFLAKFDLFGVVEQTLCSFITFPHQGQNLIALSLV